MQFLAPAMRQALAVRGESIKWFRSVGRCTCFNTLTGEFDVTHTLCGGTGILLETMDTSLFKALVTDVNPNKAYDARIGQLQTGDVLISTFPGEIDLSEGDFVIIPSRTITATEQLTRGSGSSDNFTQQNVSSVVRIYGPSGPIVSGYSLVGNTIHWTSGPTQGTNYAVRFTFNPKYHILSAPILKRLPDPILGPVLQRAIGRLWNVNVLDPST